MDNNNLNNEQQTTNQQTTNQQTTNQQTTYQQPVYQQPVYQQPVYQQPVQDTSVMSVGQWMLTTLVLALPCIGLIMSFVWAFGNGNVNRKNYCRAWLIWYVIAIVLGILFSTVMGAAFAAMMESIRYY